MAQEYISDRWGNNIYLTDERWEHIVETHDEMVGYRTHIFTTLCSGQRRQDAFDPSKYKYTKRFTDLPEEFTRLVVVVKFTQRKDALGTEGANNFVLTAYQVSRR
jgi:hypothetical protein